jgi:ABC-type nitrate/sulfonate/bicarbonate transport system permease component
MTRLRPYVAPVLVILLLLGAWELAARWDLISGALNIEGFLVPAPSDIATSLWQDRSLLADDSWVTIQEVVLGFLLALVAGLAFAIVLHLSETLRRAFYPLLVASQTIPPVAVAPILVVWFGFGLGPKLLLIALVCFFPVTVNTLDGLRSVDPQLITMMRTLGASRAQILTRVELPSALPFFFSGTKIAIAVAVIGAVFAEWAGAGAGLGHQILIASSQLLTARMFAAITLLSAMAIVLFALVSILERRVVTWEHGGRRGLTGAER